MPYFSDLAASMARRRKAKKKKMRTREELDLAQEIQAMVIAKIDGLIDATGETQGAVLKKADLSVEMLRKWRNQTGSPTLRSLAFLLFVLDKRQRVYVAATADGAIVDAEEDGAMPDNEDDDLVKKIDSLPEIDQARVEGYVDGLGTKAKPHPPELAERSPGSRPPVQPK